MLIRTQIDGRYGMNESGGGEYPAYGREMYFLPYPVQFCRFLTGAPQQHSGNTYAEQRLDTIDRCKRDVSEIGHLER